MVLSRFYKKESSAWGWCGGLAYLFMTAFLDIHINIHGFVYKLMIYFFRLSSRSKAALTARFAPKFAHKGGSQLIDLIIVELKNHMTR